MPSRFTGLWRHPDFLKLWAARTISLTGSSVTSLALPLTAVLFLNATPAEMGLLAAVGAMPFLLFGLVAGAWVDQHRRRPILIAADLGRAALLFLIPLAAILGMLRIEHLYVVAFFVGILNLFFIVSLRSFLPCLIDRTQLMDGNSKLEVSSSIAEILGKGIAGGLVELLTAPVAIVLDALSFAFSAVFIGAIKAVEVTPEQTRSRRNPWNDIREGLAFVLDDKRLRAMVGALGMLDLFNAALEAVWLIYITRELSVEPTLLGLALAAGSIGMIVGTQLPGPLARRIGLGRSLVASLVLLALSDLVVPLVGNTVPKLVLVALLIGTEVTFAIGLTIFNIGQVSLRQAITPDRLQGRTNGTFSFLVGGTVPLGGLLGGALGQAVGPRSTLVAAAIGEMLAVLWLVLSPLWALREPPAEVDEGPIDTGEPTTAL